MLSNVYQLYSLGVGDTDHSRGRSNNISILPMEIMQEISILSSSPRVIETVQIGVSGKKGPRDMVKFGVPRMNN